MNMKDFQCVTDWLNEVTTRRTGSNGTKKRYIKGLGKYCVWRNMTPEELLKEDVPYRKGKKMTVAEMNVTKYFQFQTTDGGLMRTTAKSVYGILRSFFRFNEVVFYGKTPSAGSKAKASYSLPKDKVMQTVDLANLPTKYAITGLAGTGMRPGDFIKLVYGDVKQDYEADAGRLYVEKDSEKEDLKFGVFLNRQATKYLRLMLEGGKRKGQKINNNTPLMTHSIEGYEGFITEGHLRWMIKSAGERVGLYITPKFFRKNFRTLASPVIGRDAVCKMAAWTIPGVGGHYFLPPKEECLKTYRQIEDLFTYEEKKTTEEQAVDNLINFAISQGLPPPHAEELRKMYRVERLTQEEVALRLREELKQVGKEAGGAPFQVEAAKQLAQMFRLALRELKEH